MTQRSNISRLALTLLLCAAGLVVKAAPAETAVDEKLREGLAKFQAKDYPEAERLLGELVNEFPERPHYWFDLGAIQIASGELGKAIQSYAHVVRLGGELAAPSRIYLARCYRKLGRFEAAARALQLDLSSLPAHAAELAESEQLAVDVGWLKKGMALLHDGEASAAVRELTHMVKLRPIAEAYQALGMAELESGDPTAAAAALGEVVRGSGDESLKRDARDLLVQLHTRRWSGQSPFFLTASLAGGYDSNLYDDGSDVIGRSQAELQLRAGYDFMKGSSFSVRSAYDFLWDEYENESGLRVLDQTLAVQLLLRDEDFRAQLTPSLQYDRLGPDPFVTIVGAELELARVLGPIELGVRGAYGQQFSGAATYAYEQGHTYGVTAFLGYYGSDLFVGPGLFYLAEETGDLSIPGPPAGLLPLASHGYGPQLTLSWLPHPLWQLQSVLSYSHLIYLHRAQPTGTQRIDDMIQAQLKLSYRLTAELQAFGQLALVWNQSTLHGAAEPANKNFNQSITLLGLSWNLF